MPYQARVQVTEGVPQLYLERETDGHTHVMPVDALPNYAELLGYSDLADVVEAIVRMREDETEPEPDPVTGKNLWTEAYAVLRERERVREEEVQLALEEGTANDPRSPRLRGALAARAAMVKPMGEAVKDGGSLLCAVQREARRTSGCPEPHGSRVAGRAGGEFTCDAEPHCGAGGEDFRLCAEDRARIAQAIEPYWGRVKRANVRFLHGLGPDPTAPDPLDEEALSEAEVEGLDALAAKYAGQSQLQQSQEGAKR